MSQKYGYLANGVATESKPCLVCDDPRPTYSWTDYHGEGYCVKCGTPYQLKAGEMREGETYPRCNLAPEWVPICRRFYAETGKPNGTGTFMGFGEYRDQEAGLIAFNAWCKEHESELPKKSEAPSEHKAKEDK